MVFFLWNSGTQHMAGKTDKNINEHALLATRKIFVIDKSATAGIHSWLLLSGWRTIVPTNKSTSHVQMETDYYQLSTEFIFSDFFFGMIFPSIYHHFWITACRWPCTAHAHTKSKQVAIVGFSPRPLTANSFIHRCHKLRGDQIHNGI